MRSIFGEVRCDDEHDAHQLVSPLGQTTNHIDVPQVVDDARELRFGCQTVQAFRHGRHARVHFGFDSKGVQSSRERRIPFGAAGVEHPQWVAAAREAEEPHAAAVRQVHHCAFGQGEIGFGDEDAGVADDAVRAFPMAAEVRDDAVRFPIRHRIFLPYCNPTPAMRSHGRPVGKGRTGIFQ